MEFLNPRIHAKLPQAAKGLSLYQARYRAATRPEHYVNV